MGTLPKQNSQNVSHREQHERAGTDERVRRTRARIDSAFVELLHRRPYGNIRTSDIVKKARVGRATFYAHYSDKDHLLRSQFERIVLPMLSAKPGLLDATAMFAHIRSAPHLYKALMGPSSGAAPRVLRQCFEKRACQVVPPEDVARTGLRKSALPRLIASTLITLLECWFEQGAHETPQQVQAIFDSVVSPLLCGWRS